jgi:hypothetical protein
MSSFQIVNATLRRTTRLRVADAGEFSRETGNPLGSIKNNPGLLQSYVTYDTLARTTI